jgi:hypothetical protein
LPPCRKETLESRQLPEAPPSLPVPSVRGRDGEGQLGKGDDFDDRDRVSHRLGHRFRLQRKSLTVGQGAAEDATVAGQSRGDDLLGLPDRLSQLGGVEEGLAKRRVANVAL